MIVDNFLINRVYQPLNDILLTRVGWVSYRTGQNALVASFIVTLLILMGEDLTINLIFFIELLPFTEHYRQMGVLKLQEERRLLISEEKQPEGGYHSVLMKTSRISMLVLTFFITLMAISDQFTVDPDDKHFGVVAILMLQTSSLYFARCNNRTKMKTSKSFSFINFGKKIRI